MEVVVTSGAIRRVKLQSNCHHQQTNTQLFTGWMAFLSPNQQCQSTEGKHNGTTVGVIWKVAETHGGSASHFYDVAIGWLNDREQCSDSGNRLHTQHRQWNECGHRLHTWQHRWNDDVRVRSVEFRVGTLYGAGFLMCFWRTCQRAVDKSITGIHADVWKTAHNTIVTLGIGLTHLLVLWTGFERHNNTQNTFIPVHACVHARQHVTQTELF